MIDIQTALYNILHSRYGRDVRQSIHDGIYQINANANEALQNAKTMAVGTAVSSATASSEGFVSGNLYLNNSTWDIWKCIGTNSWENVGNIKGLTGDRGTDGVSYYVHVRYSQHYDGTDFTVNPTSASQYIGVYAGTSSSAPTNKAAYNWAEFVGASGTSSYIHIRYSAYADGTDFVDAPLPLTKYIGIYTGTSSSAPASKQYYTWSKYVGESGSGSGDMLKSEYAGKGIAGTVDKAEDAVNALNLKDSNGNITSVTSLMETVDNIIVPDNSEAWNDSDSYAAGVTKIHRNKVWKCKVAHSNKEPEVASDWETYWEQVTLSALNTNINTVANSLLSKVSFENLRNVKIGYSRISDNEMVIYISARHISVNSLIWSFNYYINNPSGKKIVFTQSNDNGATWNTLWSI